MYRLLNYFKNLRYKHKLFVSYMIVAVIPLIVLGVYSYTTSRDFSLQQAKTTLGENIKKIADNINYKLERYNSVTDSIAYNTRIVQIFNVKYRDLFSFYTVANDTLDPLINNIRPLNGDIVGVTIYTGNDIAKKTTSIPYMKPITDKFYVENTKDGINQKWLNIRGKLFGFKKFMELRNTRVDNAVSIELNVNTIFSNVAIDEYQNYGMIITDKDKNIIYSNNKFTDNRYKIDDKMIITLNEGISRLNKENYLVIKKEIPEPGWYIYCYILTKSMNIDLKRILAATLVIIGICLMLMTSIIWIFSVTFVKRINNLNKKVKQVTEGNLKVSISSNSRDEIGELTNGFGNMVRSVNSLIDEVYHSKIVLKEAEMKALQSQINPHFLYNTLSLINWKAIKIRATDISHITTTISKYYRTALNRGKNIISIEAELENTRAYIEIQLVMHDYSFKVNYNIDVEINRYSMINLVLQPIVENAIEHGIDKKVHGDARLDISASFVDGGIEFLIDDNGPGMSDEDIHKVFNEQSKGYGLKNVQDRIKLFFGDEYGVSIKSEAGRGTQVRVYIPRYCNT